MKLRTVVRDSLYLTWALPSGVLPPPPRPLRRETHLWEGEPYTFVSLVLAHQEGLRVRKLPFLRLSYPQLNLITYVLDADREPAVLLLRVLVPSWMVPGARLITRYPVSGARFDCPRPSEEPERESWRWCVERDRELVVEARRGAARLDGGPRFGSWRALVEHLRGRRSVYADSPSGLRKVDLEVPVKPAWPLAADIERGELLPELLPLPEGMSWPRPYAAWLDAELPLLLDFAKVPEVTLARHVPAPG